MTDLELKQLYEEYLSSGSKLTFQEWVERRYPSQGLTPTIIIETSDKCCPPPPCCPPKNTYTRRGKTGTQGVQGVQGIAGSGVAYNAIQTSNGYTDFTKTNNEVLIGSTETITVRVENDIVYFDMADITAIQGIQGIQGEQGVKGLQGIQGIIGEQGIRGEQGTSGLQGLQGNQGIKGNQGAKGLQGIKGSQGIAGEQGTSGLQGLQGSQGTRGLQGLQGIKGLQGARGEQGLQGLQGNQGIKGEQGLQGLQGSQGTEGEQGAQGVQGVRGMQGLQGSQGTRGLQGNQGIRGLQGITGLQGTEGEQGLQGDQGVDGLQGLQGIQGNQGTRGEQGTTGLQGLQGNQGTKSEQGLQGLQGNQGTRGLQGLQGNQGTRGLQGYQGTRGEQGTTGLQGLQGNQGTGGEQGTTGLQGLQGNQGNRGTRGLQGLQGNQGIRGADSDMPIIRATTEYAPNWFYVEQVSGQFPIESQSPFIVIFDSDPTSNSSNENPVVLGFKDSDGVNNIFTGTGDVICFWKNAIPISSESLPSTYYPAPIINVDPQTGNTYQVTSGDLDEGATYSTGSAHTFIFGESVIFNGYNYGSRQANNILTLNSELISDATYSDESYTIVYSATKIGDFRPITNNTSGYIVNILAKTDVSPVDVNFSIDYRIGVSVEADKGVVEACNAVKTSDVVAHAKSYDNILRGFYDGSSFYSNYSNGSFQDLIGTYDDEDTVYVDYLGAEYTSISSASNYNYSGYFNISDHQFYSDSYYNNIIIGQHGAIYYDVSTGDYYTCDTSNCTKRWIPDHYVEFSGVGSSYYYASGYYNPADRLFYTDSSYTTRMSDVSGVTYLDIPTGVYYVYVWKQEIACQVESYFMNYRDTIQLSAAYLKYPDDKSQIYIIRFQELDSNNELTFTGSNQMPPTYTPDQDMWGVNISLEKYELIANKVNSINPAKPTSYNYPSVQAVIDYVGSSGSHTHLNKAVLGKIPSTLGSVGQVLTVGNNSTLLFQNVQSPGTGVTSVGLSMPEEFSVSGSPVTTSGTLGVTKATGYENSVYAFTYINSTAITSVSGVATITLDNTTVFSETLPSLKMPDYSKGTFEVYEKTIEDGVTYWDKVECDIRIWGDDPNQEAYFKFNTSSDIASGQIKIVVHSILIQNYV